MVLQFEKLSFSRTRHLNHTPVHLQSELYILIAQPNLLLGYGLEALRCPEHSDLGLQIFASIVVGALHKEKYSSGKLSVVQGAHDGRGGA